MNKCIPINYFPNGYSVLDGGSCVDLPIAIVAGREYEKNYFDYLFFLVVEQCWDTTHDDFFNARSQILRRLNLQFIQHKSMGWDSFFEQFQVCIDASLPIIMPVIYSSLFYEIGYKMETSNISHAILLLGYNEDAGTVTIGDCNVVEHGFTRPNKDYAFYQLRITVESLKEIWDCSNKFFDKSSKDFKNIFYTIETISNKQDTEVDIVKYFINHYSFEKNNMVSSLYNMEDTEEEKINNFFVFARRSYLGQMKVFFDCIEKRFSDGDKNRHKQFETLRDEYILWKQLFMSKWHANSLRGVNFSKEEKIKMENEILEMDEKLFTFIKDNI